MPIGKNSLKRVTNNGYSSVKTSAPDMENSTVIIEKEEPKAKAEGTKTATVTAGAKTATKNTATKKTSTAKKPAATKKTSAAAEKTTAKKPVAKEEKTEKKVTATTIPAPAEVVMAVVSPSADVETEKPYCNLGDKMPTYLL